MVASQVLQQQVCQQYGWSILYGSKENGHWYVEIILGFGNKRRFESTEKQGKKEGKETVSTIALEGLNEAIQHEKSKPTKELSQFFTNHITIFDSSDPKTWEMFWKNPPKTVGIDTEGNQISPPVLAQISTDKYTILEISRNTTGKECHISPNLQRILKDDSITKIFCDNFSHQDKKCLNITTTVDSNSDFTQPPIIDLECLLAKLLGPVKTARGLSKIVTLCMPELHVRFQKPKTQRGKYGNIGRFALIQQGKAKPLRGLFDLSDKEQQYAALDSWCTLQAYFRIQQYMD